MKNIVKKLAPLALAVLVLTGCDKEYLDTAPSSSVPNEMVFGTTEGATVALNGIYRSLWTSMDNHGNYGQKSYDLTMDMMGNDVITPVRGYGWFVAEYNHSAYATATTTSRSGVAWRYYYRTINNANLIIANVDNATGTQARKDYVKGNALFLRAHSYFYLINMFQHTYKGHENAPGVPLYTEPTTEGKGRGTVQEVYNQIIADLDAAEALLEGKTKDLVSHINQKTVKGLQARVALQMENWERARMKANEARQGYSLMNATTYKAGFGVANSEWMWGLQIPNDQSTIYASFFSHMSNTAGGYAGLGSKKLITRELYEKMSATDVRKEIVQAPVADNKGTQPNYTSLKFRLPGAGSWAADYVLMRASEMYLIEAEALARLGRAPEAVALLETLVRSRDAAYVAPAISGQALIEEILIQRRIELWGEGFSILDLKRLNRPVKRITGTAANGEHVEALILVKERSITDPQILFRIPQDEINNNKALSASDQNP
ncbi:RagB/SusD family nutrient uptake outer membrane protein [Pontibacter sp. JH31]|uniref:RagB/SusD family nutrient uptake outer membrane protein n=1 Tax=Pontibacter aquaedesilientis TaxID=2766980 RepID=A0ABR7XIA7_9BACT|nr:RagB/SusD family nutrient uptake outer membrane protein [Pontibacter aquaedesilientis]MBD1398000.1 RagB/SusD family nutrient uptake outer membrane protein [Pontibacter aquaedesilientis]